MIRRMGEFFTRIMEKYLPDAYLFAIILTFISFILALVFTDAGFMGTINAWWGGIWGILAFAMQMTLILVTGHSLALAPPVKRMLAGIARIANTPAKAVFLVALVAGICSWLQWGFGLIVGACLQSRSPSVWREWTIPCSSQRRTQVSSRGTWAYPVPLL